MRSLVQLTRERERERERAREGSCCSCLQQMQATTAEAGSTLLKKLSFQWFRLGDSGSPFAEIPSRHFGGQLFARQCWMSARWHARSGDCHGQVYHHAHGMQSMHS